MNNEKNWTDNIAEETETLAEKTKGYANQAKGKVKEVFSDITDDHSLRAEAEFDKLEGKAQVEGAKAKDWMRDNTEDIRHPLEDMENPLDPDHREEYREGDLHREDIIDHTGYREENREEFREGEINHTGYREEEGLRREEEMREEPLLHEEEKERF